MINCFLLIGNVQHSITVDPIPNKSLSINTSIDVPNIPQAPPPPPTQPVVVNDDRAQLLNSITDFSLLKLKKAKTNDRSTPKIK